MLTTSCCADVGSALRIDIMGKYFGITSCETNPLDKFGYFLCAEEIERFRNYNKVALSSSDVTTLIKEKYKDINADYLDCFISKVPLKANLVSDVYENKAFSEFDGLNGWFVFADTLNVANWAHPCDYWFLVSHNCIAHAQLEWPPCNEMKLKRIQIQ